LVSNTCKKVSEGLPAIVLGCWIPVLFPHHVGTIDGHHSSGHRFFLAVRQLRTHCLGAYCGHALHLHASLKLHGPRSAGIAQNVVCMIALHIAEPLHQLEEWPAPAQKIPYVLAKHSTIPALPKPSFTPYRALHWEDRLHSRQCAFGSCNLYSPHLVLIESNYTVTCLKMLPLKHIIGHSINHIQENIYAWLKACIHIPTMHRRRSNYIFQPHQAD